MSRRSCIALAALAAWLTAGAPARAQSTAAPPQTQAGVDVSALSAALGQTVTAVHFTIEDAPSDTPALLAMTTVKAGAPLTLQNLRASEQQLAVVGQFEEITVEARHVDAGVEVTFKLTPRHPVDQLAIAGDDLGLGRVTLDKLVRARYAAGSLATALPVNVSETVRAALVDEGYLTATVTPSTVKTHNPDRATLVLTVAAGPRARITNTEVRCTKCPITGDEILTRTGAGAGQPYRRRAITAALAALRTDLQAKGYFAAIATLESPVLSTDHTTVQLSIRVDAGPRVDVRYQGDPPPEGDPETYVPIRREGAVDDDLLEDSRVRLETGLKSEGYVHAHVDVTKDTSTPDLLVVTFKIDRGARFRVARIELPPDLHLPRETITTLLDVKPREVYNETQVVNGLSKVVREYQRRGYYDAKADPAYRPVDAQDATTGKDLQIVLEPSITEGPRATIDAINLPAVLAAPRAQVVAAMASVVGGPYVIDTAAGDRDRIQAYYLNSGYRMADVSITPKIAADGTRVTLDVAIVEGPQIRVGSIQVVGNTKVSSESIVGDLTLRVGAPFSEAERLESQSRLAKRGVFRSVSIQESPRLPGDTQAHIVVAVVESPATVTGYGAGVEADRQTRTINNVADDYIQLAPRAFFQVDRKNLFGRDRTLSFFSRISLKPKPQNTEQDPGAPNPSGFGFSEYRVSGTYRQHDARNNTSFITGVTSEQAIQTGYNFVHQAINAELLKTVTNRLSVSGRYALDFTKLFDAQIPEDQRLDIDKRFPQVRLSLLSGSVLWDRRNDPITPQLGANVSADVEFAVRSLGSQVGYEKAFVQASAFHPLQPSRRMVLAGRVELGLARGFARTVTAVDENGNPITEEIEDLPASQRFFAGGGTTVRGFQQDRLGVPEVLTATGLSNGGNGLVVLNLELRTIVTKIRNRDFGVVAFTDAGNIFAKASDVDFTRLRTTAGFGFRYDSSFGPFRLDFGFKLRPGIAGGIAERGWEYHLSFGEAF